MSIPYLDVLFLVEVRSDTSDVEIQPVHAHKLQFYQNSKLPLPNSSRKEWVVSHTHEEQMVRSWLRDDCQYQ